MEKNIDAEVPDDEVVLKRKQKAVACGIWFTSSGKIMPQKLKYKDSEGNMLTINNIRVLEQERRRFCGIPMNEYHCSTMLNGKEYRFRLYHYLEDCCWKIAWNC